jgi:hypothetical protein
MISLTGFFKKKETFLAIVFSALIAVFILLGWLNHLDFINAIVRESQEKLLVLAKTQAQSLNRNIEDISAEEQYVQTLIGHIDRQDKIYVLILDSKGNITVSPNKQFLGNNIFGMLDAINATLVDPQTRGVFSRMIKGDEGIAVFNFWTEDRPARVLKMIAAFSPLRIKDKLWSLVVFEEYKSLYRFLERNTRDNLIILISILLVFCVWGSIFLRIRREKIQLETTAVALDIINKQLHLQAYEGHRLERKISRELRKNRAKRV